MGVRASGSGTPGGLAQAWALPMSFPIVSLSVRSAPKTCQSVRFAVADPRPAGRTDVGSDG